MLERNRSCMTQWQQMEKSTKPIITLKTGQKPRINANSFTNPTLKLCKCPIQAILLKKPSSEFLTTSPSAAPSYLCLEIDPPDLLCSRTWTPCGIRRPFSIILRRLSIRFKLSTSPVAAKVLGYMDDKCEDFLPWLEQKAGTGISSALSIGRSAYGRSLYASEIIQAGDCILKVPFNVQLAPDNLLPEILSSLGEEVGNVAKLAVVILVEQKLGKDSEWAPYISRLPHHTEMHSTIFWNDDELEMVRLSSLYKETTKQKAQIEKDFLAIKKALQGFPETFEDVILQDFKHAYSLVTSRAWGSTRGVSMIPFADFLNHDGTSETAVLSDEGKQVSEVIADRSYATGDQVLIRYGKFSNATLLLDFGFALPYNNYDQVQFQVSIPQQDHLFPLKMGLLHRHCTPAVKDVNCFSTSWNSFTIKEVRSTNGKGRGIPQSLRAFARVVCSTSSQELDDLVLEAGQNDLRLARRPLKNRSKEIHAHEFLLSKIGHLIEQYDAFIKTLDTLGYPKGFAKHSIRRQLAKNLLTGELRVLKSASAWLKNYCSSLAAI